MFRSEGSDFLKADSSAPGAFQHHRANFRCGGMNDPVLQKIQDKLDLIELMNRFGYAIDTNDWNLYASLFTDFVDFDYSTIGGPAGKLPVAGIVQGAKADLSGWDQTQHLITNHLIAVDGDRARGEAHYRAIHLLQAQSDKGDLLTQGGPIFENGGHYSARFERQADGWKIAAWTFQLYYSRGNGGLVAVARERAQS